MKEQREPRSPIKQNSIWDSARIKAKKKMWNFVSARERGKIPELPTKLKAVGFRTGIFQLGEYRGTLEDLKEFALMKGVLCLTHGAIKYKV